MSGLQRWFERMVALVLEQGADVRAAGFWDETLCDIRFAGRLLRRNKGYAVVAVCALALGSGANIAIYTALHDVLLRPLPFARPAELVVVRQQQVKAGRDNVDFSVSEINDYRASTSTLIPSA